MRAGFMHSSCSSRCVHARTPRCTCTACGGAAHGTLPAEHAEQLELFAGEVIVPRRSSFPAAGPGEPDPQAGAPPIVAHRRTSPCPSLSHVEPDPAAAGPSRGAAGAGLGPIPQEPVSSTLPPANLQDMGAATGTLDGNYPFRRIESASALESRAGAGLLGEGDDHRGVHPSRCKSDKPTKNQNRTKEPIPPAVAPDDGDAPARRRGRTSLVGGQPDGNTGAGSMRKDLRTQPGLATPAGKQSHKKPDHSRGLRFAGDDRDETSGVPGVRQRQLAEENTSASALSSTPGAGGGVSQAGPAQTSPPRFAVAPATPGPQGVPVPDAAGGVAPTIHSHPDPSSTHSTVAAPGSGGRPSRLCACGRRAKWGSTRCRICDPWKPLASLRGMAVHP